MFRFIPFFALVFALPQAFAVKEIDELPIKKLVGSVDSSFKKVSCGSAGKPVVVKKNTVLDPSCTYTGGVVISSSNVTLDCRGARIEGRGGKKEQGMRRGILITSSSDQALKDVTVRNCVVSGFTNSLRVTRVGFKELKEGKEYKDAFKNILIENNHFYNALGTGVFIDGYVTGVTLRNSEIAGAASAGIYLEAGSMYNVLEGNYIQRNGYGSIGPNGDSFSFGPIKFKYKSTGREGISVDGSRHNVIRGNDLLLNKAGGIFLYKNCGEFRKKAGHWVRRYGADDNLIEGNRFRGQHIGVWIASRMAENQEFMECSDPAYETGDLFRVHLDYAKRNKVRRNEFIGARYGVRVEDDDNRVEDNYFRSDRNDDAVIVGTRYRTQKMRAPVTGTVVKGNRAEIPLNRHPYFWIHDEEKTVFKNNESNGNRATFLRGEQPKINPFLFVVEYFIDLPW